MKLFILACLATVALANPVDNFYSAGYIVGGTTASAGDAPYIVSLQRSSHSCGATIISANWILTAAHCIDGVSASSLNIRYNTLTHNSGGSMVKVSKIVKHPNYNANNIDNDIALLQVSTPLTLGSTNAKSIGLPAQGSDPAGGSDVLISGWGTTREGGSIPKALQKVTVPVVDRPTCNSAYSAYGGVTNNMFCAGLLNVGGKDACQGDSGGPVVAGGVVVGAVSWGAGCARPAYPGVYTRVGNYRDWIKTNSGV